MRGHTLIELTFVLFLLAVATVSAAPSASRLVERAAVGAAREAVVGLLAEARLAAVENGRATVRIDALPWRAHAAARGEVLRRVDLEEDFGVTLSLGGGRSDVAITYDALGLGRVASQTISFRRGSAVAELVVSSHGRVRRR
jgi:type II secretory pathway pseudopilin PulG